MEQSYQNSKNLVSGLLKTDGFSNNMMKAVFSYKESESDKNAIRNRIIKLKKEEAKALSRIRETSKKQEFALTMN